MARLWIVEDTAELAALIASAARARGHAAESFQGGAAPLGRLLEEVPQLAIVDLYLPDVDGRQVLQELRLRGVPAIAISGVIKGEQLTRELLGEGLARHFFEKPFDLNRLLDAADALLGISSPTASPDEDLLEELDVLSEAAEDDQPTLEATEDDIPTRVVEVSVPTEASALPPPSPALAAPSAGAASAARSTAAAEPEELQPLPFTEREAVWAQRDPSGVPKRLLPEWSQAGDLSTTAVPRLLTAYYQASHAGELKLRQGNVIKVVVFEEGVPVYAASNVAAERFTRFCVRRGILSEAQVAEVARLVKERNLRSAEALLELGAIDAARRRALLEDQVREIIWSTFSWTRGEYTFSPKRPARKDLVKLKVHPGNLILEGISRTESLVSLRRKLPDSRRLCPSPDPAYALHELNLDGQQAMLLAYADGSKTVEDLLTLADLGEREALATLLGLELLGVLIERRDENTRRRISFGI